MVFYPPPWVARLPEIPDSVPLWQFLLDESYGRACHGGSRHPFTCGLSGVSYSSEDVVKRTQNLAKGLQAELEFDMTSSSELDRVVCVFAFNTVRAGNMAAFEVQQP